MKLTTDRHKAPRGLFATAEPLVLQSVELNWLSWTWRLMRTNRALCVLSQDSMLHACRSIT